MAPMARRVQERRERGSALRVRRFLALLLAAGILPGVWLQSAYLAAWLGEGRRHLLWVTAIVLLPFAAFVWLLRHHPRTFRVALLLWGCTSWAFALFAWVVIPSATAEVIENHGAWMFSYAGAPRRAQGDRIMALVSSLAAAESGSTPFSYEQGAIVVSAKLSAGSNSLPVRMVLDTGASFTTISPDAAARLGIAPGPRSPALRVQTASGEAEYPLAVLSSLRLGGMEVGPLAVAVCAPCAVGDKTGLLGLNFTRHFQMIVDNAAGRIRLHRKSARVDRRDELEPFLDVGDLAGREEGDVMRIQARVGNLSPAVMGPLAFDVTLLDAAGRALNRQRVLVERIAPGVAAPIEAAIATHPDVASFHVELAAGDWMSP